MCGFCPVSTGKFWGLHRFMTLSGARRLSKEGGPSREERGPRLAYLDCGFPVHHRLWAQRSSQHGPESSCRR